MSFRDCIISARDTGRIKEEKADEALRAYQRHMDSLELEGAPQAGRDTQAALRAVDELATLTSDKKWQRVQQLRVAARLADEIEALPNIARMEDYTGKLEDRLEASYSRVSGFAMMNLDAALEAWRPRAAGLVNPVRDMDEVVDAAYGGKTGETARELFEGIKAARSYLVDEANARGASIRDNEKNVLPQSHDAMKVKRIGRSMEESKELWVKDHLEALDWETMRYQGKAILPHEREEILGRTFEAIVTDGAIRVTPGHTAAEHLATRMNRERFLYYKDAKSWKAMNAKYGTGNLFHQTIAQVDAMARDISIMETFGPNPPEMRKFAANLIRRKAAEMEVASPTTRGKSLVTRADEALALSNRRYIIHSRGFNTGAENTVAQVGGTIRTMVAASTLQGAYIANLGDLTFAKDASRFFGLPAGNIVRQYVRDFVPNKENRQWAINSGLIFESGISQVLNNNRFFGPLMGANIARRIADTTFRATWLTQHNQTIKWVWGKHVMAHWAEQRGTRWADLNPVFRDSMEQRGIREGDWDTFRATEPDRFQGGQFLRPADLAQSEDKNARRVGNLFMDYIYDTGRRAVPEKGTRVDQMLGGHLDRNTMTGQVMQVFSVVKAFPLTMMFIHMRDNWRLQSPGQRMMATARFAAYLTLSGAFITQLRELAAGRDPADMDPLRNPKFWGRAFLNGGSFGLLGDAVFGYGGGANLFAGPIPEWFERTNKLAVTNQLAMIENAIAQVQGRRPPNKNVNVPKDVIEYFSKYGITGWQFRLLFRRAVAEQLLREVDPQAYRRLRSNERRRERETNQKSWWKPGESSPRRGPDFGAAVGR